MTLQLLQEPHSLLALWMGFCYTTSMTIRSVDPRQEKYLEYQGNSVRMLEHLEANCDEDSVCVEIAKGWAALALAEAARLKVLW